jgi:hypothetical protein
MFHRTFSIATAAFGLALSLGGNLANANTEHFYGRWTVSDDKPVYSSKGKLYKSIDMAPCGNDFCGVAVSDNNQCGPTLFRFFTTHAKDEDLVGHGLWGATKKKLIMGYATPENDKAYMYLGLGADDMDLGGREGSTPTFEANYKNMGKADCKVN